MHDMMGMVLLMDMLPKETRRPLEFEEFRHPPKLRTRISSALRRMYRRFRA